MSLRRLEIASEMAQEPRKDEQSFMSKARVVGELMVLESTLPLVLCLREGEEIL